jgi:hypothetical protein
MFILREKKHTHKTALAAMHEIYLFDISLSNWLVLFPSVLIPSLEAASLIASRARNVRAEKVVTWQIL